MMFCLLKRVYLLGGDQNGSVRAKPSMLLKEKRLLTEIHTSRSQEIAYTPHSPGQAIGLQTLVASSLRPW